MNNLDDRLRADFHSSYLGFLTDVSEIQFSAQLIQALVCQGIHCDKSHELWFNVQGHLTRFGLQKYAIVTRLHTGSFSEGDRYTKALEKRRLKEKFGHMRSCPNPAFVLDLYQTTAAVYLHVHATLRPTEAERDLPYIVSLVPFSDRPVQFLDDLARSVVGP
ncbi:Hypothetical predicted protein [Olea europaea subsp. europaea]|uniref:Uncharacterized protein n=1 Tax=Olea europaea subsp. europaea TaxID=158383 RepID=A0A8S0V3I8_OLEEU|nr:Hypothetical predicted protein [Olea europaea subsp. europaea]